MVSVEFDEETVFHFSSDKQLGSSRGSGRASDSEGAHWLRSKPPAGKGIRHPVKLTYWWLFLAKRF